MQILKTKQNMFDQIPVISERITTEIEGEFIVITFPRFRSKFIQFIIPKSRSNMIRIKLDEHGTAVWNAINGHRTIKQIAHDLARHFNYEENYEYRIAKFFEYLYKSGFVKF